MHYRLLAIDIDGTLVNSRDEVSAVTRDALLRAGQAGICVVLATGRRYSRTLHLVEPLGIAVPLVVTSGGLVKHPRGHHTLYRAEFATDVLQTVVERVDRAGFDPLLCADTFAENFDYYQARAGGRNALMNEFLGRNVGCGRIVPELLVQPPAGVFNVFTVGTREQMLTLEAELQSALPGRINTHVLRSPRYQGFFCEVAPAGVTKWSAICWLAAKWGIAESAICAVGDDSNDIPMIRAAGLGIAMGNALPEVKAAARRVVASQDADGLAEVVEILLG